jgi:hypothetical protein
MYSHSSSAIVYKLWLKPENAESTEVCELSFCQVPAVEQRYLSDKPRCKVRQSCKVYFQVATIRGHVLS